MSAEADSIEIRLYKRADNLKTARMSIFDPAWQYISNYLWPDVSDINTEKTEGTEDWFQRIYETTGVSATRTCSVGVRNWVTPATEPWLDIVPPYNLPKAAAAPMNARLARLQQPNAPNVDANGMDEATRWCHETATINLQDLQASNFYSVVQTFNRMACTFGTALMFLEKGKTQLFKFEQFKVGTFCIAENDQKIVDTVMRWFKRTTRQIVQAYCQKGSDGKYDLSGLPEKIRKAYEGGKFDQQWSMIHHCMPMEDFKAMGGTVENDMAAEMAFASVYQLEEGKKIVQTGGYEEMPYFCVRWDRWGTENQPWGCSPGFESLPEARQLNFVTQFKDAKVEIDAYPRFLVPDNLTGELQLAAGGDTPVKADDLARGAKPQEWLTQGSNESIKEMTDEKKAMVNKFFFVDIFTALSQLGDKITESTLGAISLLVGEKLDQFTGTFDQYRTELINPLVMRMIGIAWREGKLKEPPASMMVQPGNDPKAKPQLAVPRINIKSRVTLALNEVRNAGMQKTLETIEPLLQNPATSSVIDNFDIDEYVRIMARNNGVPEAALRKLKDMQALRTQRKQMMEKQNALHNAQIAADAAGKLGRAPQALQQKLGEQMGGGGPPQQAAA